MSKAKVSPLGRSGGKKIEFEVYRQKVIVTLTGDGGGGIDFPLYETCDYCGDSHCYGECPDAKEHCSDRDTDCQQDKQEELQASIAFNGMVDGISALVLSQAIAGVDITTDAYIDSLNSTIEACGNNA